MRSIANAIVAVGLVGIGVAGLYLNVEYSGWIVAIGLLAGLSI